jgi:hypothetical protein
LVFPVAKVTTIEFGGVPAPRPFAARLHLTDGSAVYLDEFQWSGRGLEAQSPTLGALHLSAGNISELIFNPPLARFLERMKARKPVKGEAEPPVEAEGSPAAAPGP